MRVTLTGADGFTGRFVTAALKSRGIECVPLSADLTDPLAVEQVVEGLAFDRLIHLAARAFVNMAEWQPFYTVNQIGTFHLLDAVARIRPGTRCILASSAQVYGAGAEGLVDEDMPTRPGNHYALSKRAMEQGSAFWADRLEIVIARPFNYTGVGQGLEYLVPKIVDHFRRAAPVIELGNLFVKRDFGDVRSVADAYAGLVSCSSPPSVVNICTGVVHSIDDILSSLTDLSGHRIEVRVNPRFVRANDVPVLGGDASRLRAALPDWSACDLHDTLQWMYEDSE
jgi:GDP-6-deoxy-D-talose 4-dehydrogenase